MIATKTEQREAKGKALALGLLVAAFMVACLLLTASPAYAKTFTVNTKADSGDQKPGDGKCFTGQSLGLIGPECTLRAAIEEANKFPGADTIAFNIISIPGPALQTIEVGKTGNGAPPLITESATIDGYTQSGATKNTIPLAKDGTNAVLKIELDGTNSGTNASGLEIDASNVVVRGLVISSFNNSGINFLSGGAGHKVEGNFIGTDPSGTLDEGSPISGVRFLNTDNSTIGGTSPGARNLISGNSFSGVLAQNGSSGNKIQGNLIGTDKNGTADLGNDTFGVVISGAPNNTIGDSDPTDGATNAANTIAFHSLDGVLVDGGSSTGNRILSNSIYANGELGIDLTPNGVTANDPKDPDTGPNRLQNYPLITSATTSNQVGTTINGTLESTPSTRRTKRTFTIQLFSSPAADSPSGYGEGETFLGQTRVTTNRQGQASFGFAPAQEIPEGEFITATATRNSTGDTSEFSEARVVEGSVIGG